MRHLTQAGLDLIKRFEGFSIYLPAGYPTIGNLVREHEADRYQQGVTEQGADDPS